MKCCLVTKIGDYAIGDSIYANIAIRYLSQRYHKIFTWHPLPSLFSNIQNIHWINPASFAEHVFSRSDALSSIWMKYAAENIDDICSPMEVSYDDHIDVFTRLGNGEGFRSPGYYYPEKTISGDVSEWIHRDTASHSIYTPEPSHEMLNYARLWMKHHGVDFSKPVIYLHPTWRGPNRSQLQSRSALDSDFSKLKQTITSYLNPSYVDAEVQLPNLHSPYPETPAFPLAGVNGVRYTKAVMSLCDGVALQGSCRLLPIAQSCEKPVLCMNRGGHNLRVLNWPRFTHKPFIEVEPETVHECNPCGVCEHCSDVEIGHIIVEERAHAFAKAVSDSFNNRTHNIK